jgi:hypothetical protein
VMVRRDFFGGGACDREPGLSIGHVLRRRCGDAEGVSGDTNEMTAEYAGAEVWRQRQPFDGTGHHVIARTRRCAQATSRPKPRTPNTRGRRAAPRPCTSLSTAPGSRT